MQTGNKHFILSYSSVSARKVYEEWEKKVTICIATIPQYCPISHERIINQSRSPTKPLKAHICILRPLLSYHPPLEGCLTETDSSLHIACEFFTFPKPGVNFGFTIWCTPRWLLSSQEKSFKKSTVGFERKRKRWVGWRRECWSFLPSLTYRELWRGEAVGRGSASAGLWRRTEQRAPSYHRSLRPSES